MPFRVPLGARVQDLSAGERQKTEILKQLYLDRRFLILDEPTSVLTPAEADEMLGLLRGMTEAGALSVLMISHKFREVMGYADEVTVPRRGRYAGGGQVKDLSRADMAAMMIGSAELPSSDARAGERSVVPILVLRDLRTEDDVGMKGIGVARLEVHGREIVGIAGVSGNGQKQLVEVLGGQRLPARATSSWMVSAMRRPGRFRGRTVSAACRRSPCATLRSPACRSPTISPSGPSIRSAVATVPAGMAARSGWISAASRGARAS
jgi:simple sugar transport system ATP-binding protein